MNQQLDLLEWKKPHIKLIRKRKLNPGAAKEWKIVSLRETAPAENTGCGSPAEALQYWKQYVATAPTFSTECECFVVLLLTVKHRIRGHQVVSIGSLNETIAHPREVFRAAVIGGAYAIVLMHNHPSGDPEPSRADKTTTQRLQETGIVLCIHVADHVIVGNERYFSFKEAGLV